MAVIESKGDGYALYNGVKLPSLPEYDTGTYQYATIFADRTNTTVLVVSRQPLEEGSGTVMGGEFDSSNGLKWSHIDIGWGNTETIDNMVNYFPSYNSVVWTNYDMNDYDTNTVFLPASDPIPLDGMNVIEWDGDTTGLTLGDSGENWYVVVENANIDVNKGLVRMISTNKVYTGDWSAAESFYSAASVRFYPSGEVEFKKTSAHNSLLAYYPIEEEPEEPTEEMSRGKVFILHRMFSNPVAHALTGKWFWRE
jgi:hypothetical protein